MKFLAPISAIFLLLFASGPVRADDILLQNYWSQQDYIAATPGEQQRTDAFVRRVALPGAPLAGTQKSPVKIVIVYPALQVSGYWRRSVAAFEARLRELKIDYLLDTYFTKPGSEVDKQSKLIGQALEAAPDFFVFTLDALRHKGLIERVMARGQTKIILQNITTPLKVFGAQQPFFYVGFDHVTGTLKLVEHYLKVSKGKGSYALFYGAPGYVSTARGESFRLAMAKQPGVTLKASYYVGFNRRKSRDAALEVIADYPDLSFIYASTTDIALGISDALRETGKGNQIMVNGWGGGSSELDAIYRKSLNFTVMRMNDDNGIAMAEAIKLSLEGRSGEVPKVFSGAFAIVDQSTPAERLRELQNYAFRYSN